MQAPRDFRKPAIFIGALLGAVSSFIIWNILFGWKDIFGRYSLTLTAIGTVLAALMVAVTWGKQKG